MSKNPTIPDDRQLAVALKYDAEKDSAPKVAASGSGVVAEEIIKRAREHDIPTKEDPKLARLLSQLSLDSPIPPDLYDIIAEILAWVYKLDQS